MDGAAHVITVGNEKGGSGKSTTAMHLIVALLRLGHPVGAIDLDARQRTLTRYVDNRRDLASRRGVELPMPELATVERSKADTVAAQTADETARFEAALDGLKSRNDFVVIDSPGSDTFLARLGHQVADTLVTPMNDSFIDFDLLGQVDPETYEVKRPSLYSELVWESRKRRALKDRGKIDWIVMRNRLSTPDAKNKRRVADALETLAPRIGFRLAPGFGERVIYRELFPLGLTLLDLGDERADVRLTMSHVAARQEVRDLMICLQLPGIEEAP
ncbi:MAG: AAA family ATPase [Alphaproteobacteria bacterium]|nr:AAA family ATPase [Alphaproteobacteria bacterium]